MKVVIKFPLIDRPSILDPRSLWKLFSSSILKEVPEPLLETWWLAAADHTDVKPHHNSSTVLYTEIHW